MTARLIHKCDACGVEEEEPNTPIKHPLGQLMGIPAPRRAGNWAHLNVGIGGVMMQGYDLCTSCCQKVIALLGIKLPEVPQPSVGFYGDYRPMAPGQIQIVGGGSGLTIEEQRELGLLDDLHTTGAPEIDPKVEIAPGVNVADATFTCPKCSTKRDCQSFNPVCLACGYQDPDPKYGG